MTHSCRSSQIAVLLPVDERNLVPLQRPYQSDTHPPRLIYAKVDVITPMSNTLKNE